MRRSVLGVCLLAALLASPAVARAAVHRSLVTRGFNTPVQVVSAPPLHGLYIVEQAGRIIRYQSGQKSVFLDIRNLVLFSGEQGFLSVAFSPNYQTNRHLFVYYINNAGDSVVARYTANSALTRARESTRRRMAKFRQPPGQTNHKGGTLAFGPNGRLYLGLGDGGGSCDPNERAQNPRSPLGKIHQLRWDAAPIVALGLRNPFRMSFDSQTGDLWIGDVGQSAREEIDLLPAARLPRPAENFEWDVKEGDLTGTCENTGYGPGRRIDPVLDYPRSGAGFTGTTVIGGYRYRGTDLAGAQGDYFFGDFGSGHVATINGPGDSSPTIRFDVPNVVSFGEGPGRELFVLSIGGSLYRIDDD
jgi:hypothetical protein